MQQNKIYLFEWWNRMGKRYYDL